MTFLSPVFAIAYNSFQEAVRSKVFLICIFILGVLCLMAPLLPSVDTPILKLKLVLSVSTSICYIFGLIILIFTSSNLISDDISSRRIFTIFPKPVSRLSYLCGKLLGISYLAVSLMIILAIIVIFFVRFTYFTFNEDEKLEAASFFQMIETESVDKIELFQNGLPSKINRPATSFNVTFNGVSAGKILNLMTIRFLAYFRSKKDLSHDGVVYFDIKIMDQKSQKILQNMKEVKIQDGEFRTIDLPENLFSYSGKKDLKFIFSISEKSQESIGGVLVKQTDILLRKPSSSFELNVFKAFILLAAQFVLLGFICIMGSTRLSSFVAIMLALTLFIAGYYSNFFMTQVKKHERIRAQPNAKAITFLDKVGEFSDKYVSAIVYLAPDFGKYSLQNELVDGFAIKNSQIIKILMLYMIYFIGYMIVALLLFWRREFT
ncbi:MAG: hypothetical protein COA79_15365 [Planctomycetota bacterium]|nr:MAG: hypothetical protein COA79_15365 [Planctomycetota bacterium]